jgi:hypothetical protein
MLSRRRTGAPTPSMPFSAIDLLLALAPTSVLLLLSWALRRIAAARPAGAETMPQPERHGELVPAYAPADA